MPVATMLAATITHPRIRAVAPEEIPRITTPITRSAKPRTSVILPSARSTPGYPS
jgi:hypothetical protein